MFRDDYEERPVHHTTHEWTTPEATNHTIVTAVSAISGEELTAQPPLNTAADPDALDALFRDRPEAGKSTDHVTLTYAGYEITAHRNGHVVLRRVAEE